MYVKEISLDGFKSYAQRVDIPGFDPQFNAITGLNGSGKSNILDSICFVLGIQNLQQVRANSLQELVYKQGQAGVTKATVSIVFNNSDKENSPVGYDHLDEITVTRQLVIGGKSKYLINGKNAEPTRVQNLFHSVQLNVNNPHFLIMQGRITKVLNMKPPEILGLLEEAAGTKMYETKKQVALRTLEKKQIKVDEINKVLSEDIMPALDKLRKEKVQYMEWQNASSKMERLQRFCVAYKYTEATTLLKDGESEVKNATTSLQEIDSQIEQCDQQLLMKANDIKGLEAEKETKSSGEVKELSQECDSLSKTIVQETSKLNNANEALQTEVDLCSNLDNTLKELDEEKIASKIKDATVRRDAAASQVEEALQAVIAAQNELAGAEAGDGRDASNRSLQERLQDAQNTKTEAEGEIKAAETAVKHNKKRLQEAQKTLGAKEKSGSKVQKELEKEEESISKLKQKMKSLDFDSQKALDIENEIKKKQDIVHELRDKVDQLSSQVSAAEFHFKDPIKGFDRSKVKGVVAKLVRVADAKYASALEVAAGGKLYQVIVDNEQTAKSLLSGGNLRNRVTIIPLNKVTARSLSKEAKEAAKAIAGEKATPAIELIGYDNDLSAAMNYAFGSSFVCQDSSTAKKLAFHKDVASRCVTLDGDDFNPSGTLTGGSRNKTNSVLTQLHLLSECEEELHAHQKNLENLTLKLKALNKGKMEFDKYTKELEIKEHSLQLLKKRVEESELHQLIQTVSHSEEELAKSQEAVVQATIRKQELAELANSLENQIANFDKEKVKRIQETKKKIEKAKENVETMKKSAKDAEASLQMVLAESESAASERKSIKDQILQAQNAVAKMKEQVQALNDSVDEMRAKFTNLSNLLEEKRSRLRECDEEISEINKEISALENQKTDLIVEKKKLSNRIDALRKGAYSAEDKCKALEREYPWIPSEMKHFGEKGSDYDWEANDPSEMFEEYEKARGTIDTLSKKVNKKVMQMFEKAEHEYTELKRKKDVVETDKSKIREVMDELDEKKREALETTWKKVDGDLGSIFSTLLPGTTAKLEPVEGTSFMDGLEVKVAFGGVWKDSLSELSGGQKSLLALSLILAMLLFKPAPIYILDEVDAALDLSHTQNIGRMIKSHFPQSQFIVVSLKEGMFNNANVIFRTKFIDGVSTVTRTVNRPSNTGDKQSSRREALRENIRA